MEKQEVLKPVKVDIDFIDPATMQKVCSFNQCIKKFVGGGTERVVTYPKWKNGEPLVKVSHFHSCSECGRRYTSKQDKKKNVSSFYDAAAGGEGLSSNQQTA